MLGRLLLVLAFALAMVVPLANANPFDTILGMGRAACDSLHVNEAQGGGGIIAYCVDLKQPDPTKILYPCAAPPRIGGGEPLATVVPP